MKVNFGVILLFIAALTAFATALAHTSCIYFGPECYAAQMAPPEVIESAKSGSLLAPIGTLFVSAIFVIMGCYALSAANIIKPLPKLSIVVYTLSFICIVRGILPIQFWFRYPEKVSEPILYVGVAWLMVGLFYFFGYSKTRKLQRAENSQ